MKCLPFPVMKLKFSSEEKPTVHQYEAKFQGVANTGVDHLAHQLIFSHLTFTFVPLGRNVTVLNRFFTSSNATGMDVPLQ